MVIPKPLLTILAKKFLVCITIISSFSLSLGASLSPVFFAAGLLLPNTTKEITPQKPDVEERFKEYFEEKTDIILLHNMDKNQSPWYGVKGTILSYNQEPEKSNTFTIELSELVQVHDPLKNIKVVQNRYYVRNATFIKEIDSARTVSTFLNDLIYPGFTSKSGKLKELRQRLAPLTSINQIIVELISFFKLEVTEEQAISLLENNFSITNKLQVLSDIFEVARRKGTLQNHTIDASGERSVIMEPSQYREKLADLDVSDEVRTELANAIDQYEAMQQNPHEGPLLQNYLKFVFALPWNTSDPENVSLAQVEQYLTENQFGMVEAKESVLDHLALKLLSAKPLPTVLCLVGKPGVGKTSFCKVIADSLGKRMVRVSLGGIHSEAEMRGHRRTYIGAMAGRIMEGIKRAGTNNPVFVLDELDKLATENSYHGDPAAALLEILDPEQNHSYTDHYLGVPFDLSKVTFIATANDATKIPAALRDRMEVIRVPSYSVAEKVLIAQKIIIPKLIKKADFPAEATPQIHADVIKTLIEDYTFEDGLRGLTQKLNTLIAKCARHYLKNKESLILNPADLPTLLGKAHGQLENYKQKAKEIESSLTHEARTKLFDAIERHDQMKDSDPEKQHLAKYINLFTALPWNVQTTDEKDLQQAKNILNSSHYGMDSINERILNYLALNNRNVQSNSRATILCFVGPPGVGKTSVCRAIATALGKNFERIALGGVADESEIRGVQEAYRGSGPGRILKALRKAGSCNALINLDEVDKLSSGAPAAALLEVLDPEQNKQFVDRFLTVPFDLSNVLFIATANSLSSIPHALLDRMEIIQLEGYSINQKVKIAETHIIPRLFEQTQIDPTSFTIPDDILRQIIQTYTIEAGVRKLTTVLNTLLANYLRTQAEGKTFELTSETLSTYLGAPIPVKPVIPTQSKIGVVNGLSYSGVGGSVLQIEVVTIPGSGQLKLTGQMGEVIKESAQAALSYVWAYGKNYGVNNSEIHNVDIHVNIPDGANFPVDGPSAGVAMITALMSALTQRPVDHTYAMTGTMSFQGLVGAIGGIEQKLEGARKSQMKHVFLPLENKGDVDALATRGKLPAGIEIILVDHVDEILNRVLLPSQNEPFNMVDTQPTQLA